MSNGIGVKFGKICCRSQEIRLDKIHHTVICEERTTPKFTVVNIESYKPNGKVASWLTFIQIILHGSARQNYATLSPNFVDGLTRCRFQIFDSVSFVQDDQVGTFKYGFKSDFNWCACSLRMQLIYLVSTNILWYSYWLSELDSEDNSMACKTQSLWTLRIREVSSQPHHHSDPNCTIPPIH